jgi:hypothetical protein
MSLCSTLSIHALFQYDVCVCTSVASLKLKFQIILLQMDV